MVKDLLEEYKKEHLDNIIRLEEPEEELRMEESNIFSKLLNLQTQNGSDQLRIDVAKHVKILIDNHDTLPFELQSVFT